MRIRIKKRNIFKTIKIDSFNKIDDIVFKEDILNPEKEQINIYFRGENSSGILNLNKNETQRFIDTISPLLKLIKESKKFK
jgi:hypothetical protein